MKQTKGDRYFNLFVGLFVGVMTVVALYPLYFILIASFSEPYEVVSGNVFLFPKGFSLTAYQYMLRNSTIWRGYFNSIYITLFGTLFNLFLCIPAAYALSRKNLFAKKAVTWFFLIVMYFSGGMIPGYLLVKSLNLLNKPYTLIILNGISVYNLIVARTFFQNSIPEEVFESARIDGAGELRGFYQIALPLSKPIIAVMALFFGVTRWNDYFTAMIHLSSSKYFPLQLVLRNILITAQEALMDTSSMSPEEFAAAKYNAYMAEAMKYALIMISSAPLLIAYPFVQKYFVKGVMIGAVKG